MFLCVVPAVLPRCVPLSAVVLRRGSAPLFPPTPSTERRAGRRRLCAEECDSAVQVRSHSIIQVMSIELSAHRKRGGRIDRSRETCACAVRSLRQILTEAGSHCVPQNACARPHDGIHRAVLDRDGCSTVHAVSLVWSVRVCPSVAALRLVRILIVVPHRIEPGARRPELVRRIQLDIPVVQHG